MKKIAYGVSNFKDLITEDSLYIDKTFYIDKLENEGKFNVFLRPRRFGKSLFLSSVWYYYDIRFKSSFDSIFGKLYIGKNPTPLMSSYKVLFMDFSGIEIDSAEKIESDFTFEVKRRVKQFLEHYNYSRDIVLTIDNCKSAAKIIKEFTSIVGQEKIYLIIDEYDHFANAILGEDLDLFKDIVGKGGFVRSFYESIKTATLEGVIDRLFITGVTSITLDSLTSGFNIAKNISYNKAFSQAIGFTKGEVREIIKPIVQECNLDQEVLMNDLANWYNGYLFSEDENQKIYNSDMVLYFIQNFNIDNCKYPKRMLDDNIASDYGKIMQLFTIGGTEENYPILEELITTGKLVGLHKTKLDIIKSFDRNDFLGLLYYMGFITLTGEEEISDLIYKVPNYVIPEFVS